MSLRTPEFEFGGRIAFVTGAASGIGLAIARSLVAAGARVAMADLDEPALAREVAALGGAALAVPLDVTDREAWRRARDTVARELGQVSILVNNAGIGPDGFRLQDMAPRDFDRLIAIKLTGTFNGIQTFLPGIVEVGSGHVVNTASMAGLIANARLGAYTAAKFAVVGLSEVLSAELAGTAIGVSVLCPGLVATNLGVNTVRSGSARALRQSTEGGIDPTLIGEMTIAAIRTNRLHVVSHGEYRGMVEDRLARVVSAFDGVPIRSASATLPGADIQAQGTAP